MGKLTRVASLMALVAGLGGCVVGRQITDVVAHNDANSYKVQTLTGRFFLFAAWQEWTVWNCYRTSAGFRCVETEYEQSKSGFKPSGALPPPESRPKPPVSTPPTTAPNGPPPEPPKPADSTAPANEPPPSGDSGSKP